MDEQSQIACILYENSRTNALIYSEVFPIGSDSAVYTSELSIAGDILREKLLKEQVLSECYFGQVYSGDGVVVYGYMTNTLVRIWVVMRKSEKPVSDVNVKQLFRQLHNVYIMHQLNPFNSYNHKDNKITTPYLTQEISRLATSWDNSK